ncbi:exodeoxyribonuclease V subunit gamma [Dyella sp.]|uniref:exodeoxyribonuclease V subunit gamma n=1 Tax=Dyella sp. TaxID=1869338 RepID=UPI002ED579F2
MSTTLELPLGTPIEPGLMVIHGNRLEDLRDLLAAWLARAPLRPLEDEVMLVQSNGIAQWLKLALARAPDQGGLGISAAVNMQLPGRFLWTAYRATLGEAGVPATSPFDKSRLTWRLLRLLPDLLHDEDFRPLADFLGQGDWDRRFQLAERIADLFDQYQVYRADWLADWEAGIGQLRDEWRGRSTALPPDQHWQARLWQRLVDDVPAALRHSHRAAVHRAFVDQMANLPERPAGLPRRVVVFGMSSLPQQTLEALTALARFTQVFLVVANPCRHYWADIIEERELFRSTQRRHLGKPGLPDEPRFEDLHLHANPLLAAWGKQGRDFIRLLDAFDQPERYRRQLASWNRGIDLFTDVGATRDAPLLAQIQQAILDLEPLPATPERRKPWHRDDTSLSFHVAHNRQREVEVLHDRLLALFEQASQAGTPLAPRDVMVMVPDIQAYAPHVQAVFGRIGRDDPRYLPYAVADQRHRGGVPLLVALERLLTLPDSRFAVSEILDLLDVPALRQRFGIEETSLPQLRRWIEGAGVRWGLDAEQVGSLDLPPIEQNSWQAGLRRMLLGYATGDGVVWRDIAAFGDVGGLDAAIVGPLRQLLDQLARHWHIMREPAPPHVWMQRLRQLLADCFDPGQDSGDSDLLARLDDALQAFGDACAQAQLDEAIPLPIVREHWLSAIDENRLSQRFVSGAIGFGTLMPMRAIPFRVICLLGMNDGDYPRRPAPVDFDLMTLPGLARPGDRSRREDDRYLFLEALLSARETLHISWMGLNERDNSSMPPSVLVGQLRDYIAAGWHDQSLSVLPALTTMHPLQAFSRRYFDAQSPAPLGTYAREWESARQALPAGTTSPLPEVTPESAVGLTPLYDFLAKPVRYFFQQRLKVYFDQADPDVADEEPFVLTGLERYEAERQLLDVAMQSPSPGEAIAAAAYRLRAQGALPPGGFGSLAQAELDEQASALSIRWHEALARYPLLDEPREIRLLVDGWRIEDWLDGLRIQDRGYRRLTWVQGSLREGKSLRHEKLIPAWVVHLAANAQGIALTTQVIGIDAQPVMAACDPIAAERQLQHLVAAMQQGLTQPLPVSARAAFAWLAAEHNGKSPMEAARLAYEGSEFGGMGDLQRDAYLARAWPGFDAMHRAGFEACLPLYRALVDGVIEEITS